MSLAVLHKSDYRLQRGERRRGYSASRLARSHVSRYSSSIGGKLPTMSLYSLPLLRDSQSASKPLFTTCGNQSRRCRQRRDSSYGVGRARRVAWMRKKALKSGGRAPERVDRATAKDLGGFEGAAVARNVPSRRREHPR